MSSIRTTLRAERSSLFSSPLWLISIAVALIFAFLSTLPSMAAEVDRIYGPTTIDTAVTISKRLYPDGAKTVFLVNADEGVDDAVSSTSLADLLNAPILLTSPEALPAQTKEEITRLAPREVVVLGGTRAIGDSVVSELEELGAHTSRLGGKNRFETSEKLYREVVSRIDVNEVVLTTDGTSALASAGARGRKAPVILVDANGPSQNVIDLEVPKVVYQGPDQFSDDLLNKVKATRKVLGGPGSDMSVQLASLGHRDAVVLVNPEKPVETLLASRLATKMKADVVLAGKQGISAQAKQYAQARSISSVIAVGGPQEISDEVASAAFPAAAVSKADPSKPMIALTFDDGPSAETTHIVLDALKKANAKATFFMLGKAANAHPEVVKQVADAGMEIGNHSWDHPVLTKLSADGVESQLGRADEAITKAAGRAPTVFRPPYGAVDQKVRGITKHPTIMWSVDTLDWKTRSTPATIEAVMGAKDGDIVLMHDIHAPTAQAAVQFIPELVKKGYQLVTVSELMAAKGIKMESDGKYSQARK
ncbi:polysaccharide deacetylase family protein [Stomatohabitans albus]|uniref:polysaccharide deacetylase family protein n=1 Tax=Stomatohabitans albus TaxID=3110766 RepID=UPI00300D5505